MTTEHYQIPYIHTRKGRFYLDRPTFDAESIGHALGMLCRFNGNTSQFYCPTPDQRVLTADLRWVPAGDLKQGDALIGFDETAQRFGTSKMPRRRIRPSFVMQTVPVKRRIVRLEMSDGSTVKTSAEHPWLISTKVSNNQSWRTAEHIARDLDEGRVRYINRFMPTWGVLNTRDAGWLAGIYDGEGHISFRNRKGLQWGVAQNPGATLNKIEALHQEYKFDYANMPVGTSQVRSLQIRGGWREFARLLGSVRPHRLLNKFQEGLCTGAFEKQMSGQRECLTIVKAYDEGKDWVSGIETSTHTYLCEGFGAHNSVADHSILVADLMRRVTGGDPFEGLMHDAAEAYLSDIPTPFKRLLPDWQKFEQQVDEPLRAWAQLPKVKTLECEKADKIALFIEAQSLIPEAGEDFEDPLNVRPLARELTASANWYLPCREPITAGYMWVQQYYAYRPRA